MLGILLSFALRILPAIPQLVSAVEHIYADKPRSGALKWIAVEQALGTGIQEVSSDLAALAPAGTPPAKISQAISKYAKAINDATVAVANDLGIFPPAAPPPAPPLKAGV